ncbi:MAG: hypothetical protein V4525_01710 [Pseudomonadota bacterium]
MLENEQTTLLDKIIGFILDIGLSIKKAEFHHKSFLPGITVEEGVIVINERALLYPGDLLHEAGHLAVIAPERRTHTQDNVGNQAAEEMMAIAWSYAASVHLKLDPSVVFHEDGYRGDSASLIEAFTSGRTFGVPMLQWIGLTAEEKRAKEIGVEPYPAMIKWVLDKAPAQYT